MKRQARSRIFGWIAAFPLLVTGLVFLVAPLVLSAAKGLMGCADDLDCGALFEGHYLAAWQQTAVLSLGSSALALPLALMVCLATRNLARRSDWQSFLQTVSTLASHFAGVPLALAFLLLFGAQGWITMLLGTPAAGVGDPRALWWAYLYFQTALAVLLLMEPVMRLPSALEDASDTLGASRLFYWGHVVLPLLAPTLLDVFALLVANAGAAYATPFALSGTSANLLAVNMASMISGDIFQDPRLVHALAALVLLVLLCCVYAGRWLSQRLERRWL